MTIEQISLSLISLAILVGVSAASYYLVVVQPEQEERRAVIEQTRVERDKEQERQQIYKDCHERAEKQAIRLMETKVKVKLEGSIDPSEIVPNEDGLYLRTDYELEFHACLRSNGILDVAN